jgi:CRP/FNR family transcriptional regulator
MLLLNASLFNLYPPVEISDGLWNRLHGNREVKAFKKNEMLTVQEQPVRDMIVLKKGRVKAMFMSADGGEVIFEILDAPAIFGHQALYCHQTEQWYPNLVALTDSEAVFVPIGEVERLIDEEPALLKCFYQCLRINMTTSSRLSFWSQRLNLLQKVAFALTMTGNLPRDGDGWFSMTHENLAHFLGATRENVTNSLNRLCEMGFIEKKPGKIRIANAEAFVAYINETARGL